MLLVTGVTGKSGGQFLRTLEAEGYQGPVRAVVRPTSNTQALEASGLTIEKREGILEDEAFLQGAMEGVKTVVHITNIAYSPLVVKTALAAGVKRLILVHTTGIYSKYKSASEGYLKIEADIEEMLQDSEATVTILRPTMIYGNLNDGNISVFIRMVDRLRFFPVVDHGSAKLQPVHMSDVGNACYQVLMAPEATAGKGYNISGKKPIALVDILREISRQLGRKNTFLSVPFPLAYNVARALNRLSGGKKDYRERVQRLVEERVFSHEEASRDFGYDPLDFPEGVRGEIEAYLASKSDG